MLGVYLIHDDVIIRSYIWERFVPNVEYAYSNFLIIHAIVKVMVVFIICIILDKIITKILKLTIYQIIDNDKIFDKLSKYLNKHMEKIYSIMG